MTNLGYLIAAYVITLGTLAGYALVVWSRLRAAEHELTTLNNIEEGGHDRS